MNQINFDQLGDIAKKVQQPIQALAELNVKTLQTMTYLKPEELTQLKKPEDLFEKQINMVLENGHKTIDYMQKSFQIMEEAMKSFVLDVKHEVKKAETAIKK
jgi:hypothetical protein